MNPDSRNHGFAAFLGIVLVLIGTGLLVDRFVEPLLRPIEGVMHAMGYILWPLLLVGAGAVLLVGGLGSSGERRAIAGMYRSRTDRVVGGVLGGVAERFGVESGLVRIVYVLFSLITGLWAGALFYVLAMALLPEGEPSPYVSASPIPEPPAPPVSRTTVTVPPSVPRD